MKPVLIIENSTNGLKLNESVKEKKNDYILHGPFTSFDMLNRNERVYTANDFVPHVDEMMKKREWGVIYGEFDHPDTFDVSMKFVSHTIESATYNTQLNHVEGEIRLLNTHYGKDAKALVDDGLPLFVSSRAAGVTESNGFVKLKQLFTYDIVADPGFATARMSIKTLNESCGLNSKNVAILEASKQQLSLLNEKYQRSNSLILNLSDESDTNELFNMNKNDYVTKNQLTEYSKHLISEVNKNNANIQKLVTESKGSSKYDKTLSETIAYNEELKMTMEKVIQYLDYLSEKVSHSFSVSKKLENKTNKIVEYSNYLGENLENNIKFSNYIAEHLDKNIAYSEYLAENVGNSIKFSNYLAENLDKVIDYSQYIAENLDKGIDYIEYIAENLDKNINYSEYIAENLMNGLNYMEYIAENVDANIGYTQYIGENVDQNISYSEYLSECIDKTLQFSNSIVENINNGKAINEKLKTAETFLKENNSTKHDVKNVAKVSDKKTTKINETKTVNKINETKSILKDKQSTANISQKIDLLITETKKRKASEGQIPNFYNFLTPDDIKAFESLEKNEQEEIRLAISESVGYYSRHDVLSIWRQVTEKAKISPEQSLLDNMPDNVKPLWEKCDDKMKKSILSQSRLYDISNPTLMEHFWNTRPFKTVKENKKVLLESSNPFESMNKLSDAEITYFTEKFDRIK